MMVDELRTLLHEAVATPPADDTDLVDVTRRGARARRRRTTWQVAAAGAAVLAVVGGAALSGDLNSRQSHPDAAAGKGTSLADAVPIAGDPLAEADATITGTTQDGLGLLWDETESPAGYRVRIGLLDPDSGQETWLPDSPAVLTEPLELSEDRLVFLTEVEKVGPQVGIYDRRTGTWRRATWDGLRGPFTGYALGPDDRLWFSREGRLWSGSLTDPADLRDEGIAATDSDFDIEGTTLVSLTEGADRVTVTDLETQAARSLPIPGPSRSCSTPSVDLGGDLIALGWSCGYSGNLADPQPTEARALVMTTDGDVVADVAGLPGNLRLDAHVAGDDVLLASPSPSTTYDPDVCNFPFDGMPQRYLEAWSERVRELARDRGTPDGWSYCQLSHEVYQELVLPHLDEAQVPEVGYGYYVIDGESGRLLQLTRSTPYVTGWGFSADGRIPAGTALWDLG